MNGDTVFEIASVTKVFTALLLADMVEKNEVALSDPASKYLPAAAIKLPERNGHSINVALSQRSRFLDPAEMPDAWNRA